MPDTGLKTGSREGKKMDERELTVEESKELAGYLNEAKERHVTVGPQIAPGFTTRAFDVDAHLAHVHTDKGRHAVVPAAAYLLKLPPEGWNVNTDPMPDECEWLWGMNVEEVKTSDDGEEALFNVSIEPIDRGDGSRLSFFEVLACIAIQDAREAGDNERARRIFHLAFHVSGKGREAAEDDANTIRHGLEISQLLRGATRRSTTRKATLKNRSGKTVLVVESVEGALELKASSRKTFTLLDREATRMSMAGEYQHDGKSVCRVVLSVAEVASLYGIEERSAKNRIRRDFKAIANERLTIEKKGKGGGWVTIPVAGGSFGIRGDNAVFTLSPDIMQFLFNPKAPQVDLPPELYATDDAKHPAAFQIGAKLYAHDNQNHGEANQDRLKLTTLLDAARELPTPQELEKDRRSKTERIMGPFEAAMNHLVDIGALKAWDYCHENGEQLTDEEYQRIELEHELGKPTPWEIAEGFLVTWELGRRYPKHEAARQKSRDKRLAAANAVKAKKEKEAQARARRIRGRKEAAIAKAQAEEELKGGGNGDE